MAAVVVRTRPAATAWAINRWGLTVQALSTLTLEYVRYTVAALVNGAVYNPTGDTVQFAFTTPGVLPTAYVAGSWETAAGPPAQYVAKCLVGPGGTTTLGKGVYDAWIKITDSPEVIVRFVGQIKVS